MKSAIKEENPKQQQQKKKSQQTLQSKLSETLIYTLKG